jgi:hypothetical protein
VPETTIVADNRRASAPNSVAGPDLDVPANRHYWALKLEEGAGALQAGGHRFDPGWLHEVPANEQFLGVALGARFVSWAFCPSPVHCAKPQ